MRNRPSSFPEAAGALVGLLCLVAPSRALAQACCAGGSVITPARLALHEDALVGLQAKAGEVLGTYDPQGHYISQLGGDSEVDLEEDLFGAVRVFGRGQVAVLVPLVQTRRTTPTEQQLGGGVGDFNVSARYDFLDAGESRYLPGIALLAGVTVPTGRPPEDATPPLAADATGIGAFQFNGALAFERSFGPWLANLTGIVAARTAHDGETLAPQVTVLAAGAYVFANDSAVTLSVSYAAEGTATCSSPSGPCPANSNAAPDSAKAATTITLSLVWPLGDEWRVHGGVYVTPPIDGLSYNQPSLLGVTFTLVRSWS